MRRLILVGVLGLALPAFAAEDSVPAMEATAPAEVAPAPEPAIHEATPQVEPKVEPELAEAAPALPPVPPGAVARGIFATAIDHREPVDSITSLGSDRNRVYYYSEFVGIGGRRLTHRWEYDGEVVAEVPIAIGAPRWRAYSSKNLDASRLGEWTVSVVDEGGQVVRTDSFVYEAAAPAPEIAAPASESAAPAAMSEAPAAPAATSGAPTAPAPRQALEE
jgi:hypothetical protein